MYIGTLIMKLLVFKKNIDRMNPTMLKKIINSNPSTPQLPPTFQSSLIIFLVSLNSSYRDIFNSINGVIIKVLMCF